MTAITDRTGHGSLERYRHPSPRPSLWVVAGAVVCHLATTLLDCQERARQRRRLLALDDAALKDFGRSLADAAHEGEKPFWRA